MSAPSHSTTLQVMGYALELVGFVIAIVELFLARIQLSAAIRRLGQGWRRLLGITVQYERELTTAVELRRATGRHKIIRSPAGPEIASRVERLERQVRDLDALIDREREAVDQQLREQQTELERLRIEITTAIDERESNRRAELARQAFWSLPPLLFFVAGTALSIIGTAT